jgi:hypothetical protein
MLAVYWPRIPIKISEARLASDLVRLKPNLKWIVWGYPLGSFLWSLLLVGGIYLLVTVFGVMQIFLYIGHFTAAMGLFYGVFAMLSGVMVLPKRRTFPMWCVVGDRAYEVGTTQAFISVIAIVLNSVLISMFAP